MGSGKAYLNVHTNVFPGGEIRGFFSAVPEPASWSLMIGGFALSGAALRRRHRVAAPA
ncbi:MAG: CHRD domain-containing protein [Sphingobium sp.]|nr:CHRD domain-containing protein [Sphingobium sp.]